MISIHMNVPENRLLPPPPDPLGAVMPIGTETLQKVPFRATASVRVTDPDRLPAVNVVEMPSLEERLPFVLFTDQRYVVMDGQSPPVQVAAAVKVAFPPVNKLADTGVMVAPVRILQPGGRVTVITATGLCFVMPLSVPLAMIPTVPAVVLAVNVTD
jgi:hypothetical protein